MNPFQVHSKVKMAEPPQFSSSPIPLNSNDKPSISDLEEIPIVEDLSLVGDLPDLEQITSTPSSLDESVSSTLEIPTVYTGSIKPYKPIGRLQRWKNCLIGQSSNDNTTEKIAHVNCSDNTDDNELLDQEPFLIRKLFGESSDAEIDLSDLDESNTKVSSQGCNLVFTLDKDECSKNCSRSVSSEFNATESQSDKDLKDKLDTTKNSLNNDNDEDDKFLQHDCRICHCGPSSGKLVSPCYCTGTMGQMHAGCLEQWLGSNGRKECELCGYHYHLCREPRSFREFFNNPGVPNMARHLKCDLFCFVILTPTTLISVCLLLFAANLLDWKMSWSVVGLISTALFLLVIYLLWSIMAFMYQRSVWQKWRLTNQVVRLKCTLKCDLDDQGSQPTTNTSEPFLLAGPSLHQLPSTLTVTSTGSISEIDSRSLDIKDQDPEASMSNYISLEPLRLSQSFTDLRVPLTTSSSSTCTFSSEPSLIMDNDVFESSSNKRIPKNILKCDSIQGKD